MAIDKKSGACACCHDDGVFTLVIMHQHLGEYVGVCERCAPKHTAEIVRVMLARYDTKLELS